VKNNNQSGFHLLSDNTDAFVARLALASSAEKGKEPRFYDDLRQVLFEDSLYLS
jgi:hypothetical protein